MNLFYYYTDAPNTDYEIKVVLQNYQFSFIAIPKVDNCGNLYADVCAADNYCCVWEVQQESDIGVLVNAWKAGKLTRRFWQSLGAKRLFLKMPKFEEDNAWFDWTTRERVMQKEQTDSL